MMICNVARSVTRRSAAPGFFSMFYDWSVAGCTASIARWPQAIFSGKTSVQHISHFHTYPSQRQHEDASPSSALEKEPAISTRLRDLMRHMPHSVVVATASTGTDDESSGFRGMTVSSFTTLTLTPIPIVTFNIRKPSQTLDAIKKTRKFLIHVLSATESGARVADVFTKGNGRNVFASPVFEVLRMRSGDFKSQPPLLSSPGIIKVLRCQLREDPTNGLLEIGDHVLVLGDVVSIIEPPPSQTGEEGEDGGLCYIDREYRRVGSIIELAKEPGGA